MRISEIEKEKQKEESEDHNTGRSSDASAEIWNQGWDDNWQEKLDGSPPPKDTSTPPPSDDPQDPEVFFSSGKEEDKVSESFQEIHTEDLDQKDQNESLLDRVIRPWRKEEQSASVSLFAKVRSSIRETLRPVRKPDKRKENSGPSIINWIRGKTASSAPASDDPAAEESSELIPERHPENLPSEEFNDIEDLLQASMGTTEEQSSSAPSPEPETPAPPDAEPPADPDGQTGEKSEEDRIKDASDSDLVGYFEDSEAEEGPAEKEPEAPASDGPDTAETPEEKKAKEESASIDPGLEDVDELVEFIDDSQKGKNLIDPEAIFAAEEAKETKTLLGKVKTAWKKTAHWAWLITHPNQLLQKLGYTWKDVAGAGAVIIILVDILLILKNHLER